MAEAVRVPSERDPGAPPTATAIRAAVYVDRMMDRIHDRQLAKPVTRGLKDALKLFCETFSVEIPPEVRL